MRYSTEDMREKFIDICTEIESATKALSFKGNVQGAHYTHLNKAWGLSNFMVGALATKHVKRELLDPVEAIAQGVVTEDNLDDVEFKVDGIKHGLRMCPYHDGKALWWRCNCDKPTGGSVKPEPVVFGEAGMGAVKYCPKHNPILNLPIISEEQKKKLRGEIHETFEQQYLGEFIVHRCQVCEVQFETADKLLNHKCEIKV